MARYNVQTHDQIIHVAKGLFMKQGFQKTTTRQISQAVGISQPNLYHYYPDKETLYIAVIKRELDRVGQGLKQIVSQDGLSFEGQLLAMTEYVIDETDGDIFMMLFDLKHHISEPSQAQLYRLWQLQFRSAFVQAFQQHSASIRETMSPEEASQYFFHLLLPYFNRKELTLEHGRQMVDIFLHGVGK